MKNNKGFTLVELLGVLIVLAILAVITIPLVGEYIESSRQKAYDVEIKTIIKAAKEYYTKYSGRIKFDNNNEYQMPLCELKNSEYLEDKPIANPLDPEEQLNGCVILKKESSKLTYEYENDCTKTCE